MDLASSQLFPPGLPDCRADDAAFQVKIEMEDARGIQGSSEQKQGKSS